MRKFRFVMGIALAGTVIGCGGGGADQAARAPVSGKVTLDNQPLAGARVVFMPTGRTVGGSVSAYTDAAGQYKLEGIRGGAGAPPGEYKVVISRMLLEDGTPAPPGTAAEVRVRESLPPYYSDRHVTTLTAAVPATGGIFDFALRSK